MKVITVEELPAVIENSGDEEILITRGGKLIAKLVPAREPLAATGRDLLGRMKGKLRIQGDVMSTGLGWDAES